MPQTDYWKPQAYSGLELHSAAAGDHRYDRHSHDEYSIIVVTEGSKLLRVGRTEHAVRPGQIVVIPPGTSHDCEPMGQARWGHRCWYAAPKLVADLTGDPTFETAPPGTLPVLDRPDLAGALARSHRAAAETRDLDRDADQLVLIARTLESAHSHGRPTGRVRRGSASRMAGYLAAMNDNLGEKLNLEDLARIGGVTRFQVIRDVQEVSQMSPGNYLNDLRLRHSKRLLATGMKPAEVSAVLGFADQSHFARVFRKAYAISPGRYAKR